MLVSFIIPAYNATQTIVRCLDSIYSLPIPENDYEVIVIDDCSLDETITMVERYTVLHNNITLLRQTKNHRQGAARNWGLRVAKGKYIAFVDSDDTVETGIVKALGMARKLNLDLVAMQYGHVTETGNKSFMNQLQYVEIDVFSGIAFQEKNKYWCSGPWGYLYRMSFLQAVAYPFAEDVLYEDTDFVMNHLYRAQKMAYCQECCYLAYYNSHSTTHTLSFKHVADYLSLGVRQLVFHQRIESKELSFASDILEGGVWNINKACKVLWRLKNWKEVRDFYRRIDAKCQREYIKQYVLNPFKLTINSRTIINHKYVTEFVAFMLLPVVRALHK